jgi:hypothetical protein
LTSPFAGTVDASVEIDFSPARNAVGVEVAALEVEAAVVFADDLAVLVLLELPHPASASAASGAAQIAFPKIVFLLTGQFLSSSWLRD